LIEFGAQESKATIYGGAFGPLCPLYTV